MSIFFSKMLGYTQIKTVTNIEAGKIIFHRLFFSAKFCCCYISINIKSAYFIFGCRNRMNSCLTEIKVFSGFALPLIMILPWNMFSHLIHASMLNVIVCFYVFIQRQQNRHTYYPLHHWFLFRHSDKRKTLPKRKHSTCFWRFGWCERVDLEKSSFAAELAKMWC